MLIIYASAGLLRACSLHAPRHRSMFTLLLFSLLACRNSQRNTTRRGPRARDTYNFRKNELHKPPSLHTDRGPQPRRVHTPRRAGRRARLSRRISFTLCTRRIARRKVARVWCALSSRTIRCAHRAVDAPAQTRVRAHASLEGALAALAAPAARCLFAHPHVG